MDGHNGFYELLRSLPSMLALVGGLLLGAVIPFTLLVILPTNKQLLDPGLDRRSAEAAELLDRWGRLHARGCRVGSRIRRRQPRF